MQLFAAYDHLCAVHGVYKVDEMGDAYMCVCGCPEPVEGVEAAVRIANMAQVCGLQWGCVIGLAYLHVSIAIA